MSVNHVIDLQLLRGKCEPGGSFLFSFFFSSLYTYIYIYIYIERERERERERSLIRDHGINIQDYLF